MYPANFFVANLKGHSSFFLSLSHTNTHSFSLIWEEEDKTFFKIWPIMGQIISGVSECTEQIRKGDSTGGFKQF